jgi:hypothetical protein
MYSQPQAKMNSQPKGRMEPRETPKRTLETDLSTEMSSQPMARVNSPPKDWRMLAVGHPASPTTKDEEDCLTTKLTNAEYEPIGIKKNQPDNSTPPRLDTMYGARQRSRQTPMTSFTFKQSLEEQRSVIDSHAAQALKQRELANIAKDMSPSSLTTRTPRHTRRTQDDPAVPKCIKKTPKRQKNVTDITKYFETGQKAHKKLDTQATKSNNNAVCLPQACDKLPALPATSKQPKPGQAPGGSQPIGSQKTSHVTGEMAQEPTETKKIRMIQNPAKGGHL